MKTPINTLIKAYQTLISPFLGQNCRFYPTCSCYTKQAVKKYGAFKGLILGMKRVLKCHPCYQGKFHDPVP